MQKNKIELRDYQQRDIECIESAWTEYRSMLYQLPTGGGKSVVISKLVSDYKKENILILAHKRKLLTQLSDHLSKIGVKSGILQASIDESDSNNIVIASIKTVVKDHRLEKLLSKKWDRVIIDEARHSRTNSYDKVLDSILEKYPLYKLLGVDATPYRKDKKRLDKHFQYMVVSSETTASLIEKGFLSKYRTYVAPIGEIEKEVDEVANDFQQTQLSNYMRKPEYLNYVVDMYKQYGEHKQVIVFAVDIEHSRILMKTFIDKGCESVSCIDSSMSQDEIDTIYEQYEFKKLKILINVEMVTEGVDLPDTGCIIGARPTKSLTLYLQMVGRGTRVSEDGSDLIVLDCAGWIKEFGQLSSPKHWSLNPEINPNNPRLNNRVVGRKKDGTYEEDLTDFIGEIVEMTPEEYLANVQGGLERAETINISIDDRILALFEAIYSLLLHLMKREFAGYDYKINNVKNDYYILFIDSDKRDSEKQDPYYRDKVYLKFGQKGIRLHAQFKEGFGYSKDIEEYMKMTKLCGKLNSILLEDQKVEKQIIELFEQVIDLEKSKVNLQAFRNAAELFTEEQWKKSIDDHMKSEKDPTFVLENHLRKDNYFKGWSRDEIVAIKIIGSKVNNYSNVVEIGLSNRYNPNKINIEEKKHIKGEKIYDLLRAGKWGKEEN